MILTVQISREWIKRALNHLNYIRMENCFLTNVFWYPNPYSSSSSEMIAIEPASIGWILIVGRAVGTCNVSILGDLAYIFALFYWLFTFELD